MHRLFMALVLAIKDWRHEGQLSLCAVLALASMLSPLLVLQGVKNGVVTAMRERLMQDPNVLVITPNGSGTEGAFSEEFIASLRQLPGARFAIGRTRDIATDITLQTSNNTTLTVQLEPCAPGEPVLDYYKLPIPQAHSQPEIILSSPAARALNVSLGDTVKAALGRRIPTGKLESVTMAFTVIGILPAEAANRRLGFLPLSVLEDIQDYRDYIAVPHRGYSGTERPNVPRRFASFRLYAQNLDAVESLAAALKKHHVESYTKSREIASIRNLEQAISQVILIISLAVGTGFAAFMLSSVQSAVHRKDKMLGTMRLLGFQRIALLCYPLMQTLLTALCGVCLAGLLYLCVSMGIEYLFIEQSGGLILCRLPFTEYALAGLVVLVLSTLATMRAALLAASIEPSAVLREF